MKLLKGPLNQHRFLLAISLHFHHKGLRCTNTHTDTHKIYVCAVRTNPASAADGTHVSLAGSADVSADVQAPNEAITLHGVKSGGEGQRGAILS